MTSFQELVYGIGFFVFGFLGLAIAILSRDLVNRTARRVSFLMGTVFAVTGFVPLLVMAYVIAWT